MEKNKIRFAFAVDTEGEFISRHFGDADKFSIYELQENKISFIGEEINQFKNLDESKEHGSSEKGKAIVQFLQNLKIQILVSKQFGKNIQFIEKYFVPVIVYEHSLSETVDLLNKNYDLIGRELSKQSENFNLLTLKDGKLESKKGE